MLSPDDWIEVPSGFRGFDGRAAVVVYRRNLPHWRQRGATYFVTFRLADALPSRVVLALREEAAAWRARITPVPGAKPSPLVLADWRRLQRVQQRLVERTLDEAHGACPLKDPDCRAILARALTRFAGEHYDLGAFAILPNHCHALVKPSEGSSLERILQGWKGDSSRQINQHLGLRGSLWQADTYDRILRNDTHYRNVVRYIANNPSMAGLPSHQATVELFVQTGPVPPP